MLEVVSSERRAQHVDPLGGAERSIEQDDAPFADAAGAAAHPVADLAQQLLLAHLETELAGRPLQLLHHALDRCRTRTSHYVALAWPGRIIMVNERQSP